MYFSFRKSLNYFSVCKIVLFLNNRNKSRKYHFRFHFQAGIASRALKIDRLVQESKFMMMKLRLILEGIKVPKRKHT